MEYMFLIAKYAKFHNVFSLKEQEKKINEKKNLESLTNCAPFLILYIYSAVNDLCILIMID